MRLIHAVRELNARARRRRSAIIALYTEAERDAMFVREADEAYCLGPRDRGATAAPTSTTRRSSARCVETRRRRRLGRLGLRRRGPRVRRAVRAARRRLHRPERRRHARARRQDRGQAAGRGGRRAGRAVERRPGRDASRRRSRHAAAHRLPADDQGDRRRRRARHPPRRRRRTSSPTRFERARAEAAQAFGDGTVLHGAARRRRAPRRGAADRRRPRQRVGGRRARLLAASAATRRSSRSRASPALDARAGARARGRRACGSRCAAGYRSAGTVEFLYQPGEQALRLPRGQHPPAGRAPGHRGGHRRSTSSSCSSTSRPAAGSRASRRRRAATPIEARLNAEDPARGFAPAPGPRSRCCACPPGPASASTPASPRATSIPPEFDSMIAKIIAYGPRPRRGARPPAPRAGRDDGRRSTDGTTNKGFLLELLDRPEVRTGEVDTGWLDRLQRRRRDRRRCATPTSRSCRPRSRSADAATAAERARFYALARRGRPQAGADVGRTVELRHRGAAYRLAVCQIAPGPLPRRRSTARAIEVDGRARSAAHERRLDDRRARATARVTSRPGRRPAGRGRRRAAPDRARRGRPRAQPRARASSSRSRSPSGDEVARRRRRRGRREHEDGDAR